MPDSKNPLIRYKVLDQCLSNPGRNYTWANLKEAVNETLQEINPDFKGISERQLRSDIEYMKSVDGWDAPIITTPGIGRQRYYRYEDTNFSIQSREMNTQQLNHLKSTLEALKTFRGMPQLEWIDEYLVKMESDYRMKSNPEVKTRVSWDSNIDADGRQWLEPIFTALNEQLQIQIKYRPFGGEETTNVTNPLFLKQYNNRWFLLTQTIENGRIFVNPLDRIVELTILTNSIPEGFEFDDEEYFGDIIGVSNPEGSPVERIELRFEEKRYPYVLTKPLHPSQINRPESKSITVKVKINNELKSQILSFGDDIEVLTPEHLRNEILATIQRASRLY